jgi:MoxR-like ATPase
MNETIAFDPTSETSDKARAAYRAKHDSEYISYVYSEPITRAVKVALVTRRPLLLRGDPGCGKSTLARDVALCLGRRYYEHVVSSRTQARDLLWRFDAVRRLGDAQTRAAADISAPHRYVEPGVLWWAFAPGLAARRGYPGKGNLPKGIEKAADPCTWAKKPGAVVLIDEIDKADPDMPNDLLVPLGSQWFRVEEIGADINAITQPFIVITTNDERDLPPAFLRRCIVLKIPYPDDTRLLEIARKHFPTFTGDAPAEGLLKDILSRTNELALAAEVQGLRRPGTAEFLDTIRACMELGIESAEETWAMITELTLWKHKDAPSVAKPSPGTEARKGGAKA